MDYIYSQVGYARTWLLVGITVCMILTAHALAFRDAIAGRRLDWRHKPLRSLLSVGLKHQISYGKKVPYMIGTIAVLTIAVCYL